ncbi:DNA polymerase III DnaE [Bacillus coahuilensis m2-6]|uniref:DNA polymerase III subunit alpha n=1 Tax=Bacillus coahuilensis TaxID=408580 RepID=UPI0007506A25|nr:DNA polymerase III subunit alpha [Bacillus coahuilensis]KUP06662.1 DNA polymerase III DnaE [Bacillus coahuilensis m2-6]
MSFVHLQVWSAYSLLESTISIEKLVQKAKSDGYTHLALTDKNVMYGVIPFYQECRKVGIQPIIGVTADILHDDDTIHPLVLLAETERGYRNLMKISSVIQTKPEGAIPFKWLKGYKEGLIAITPGEDGKIEDELTNGAVEAAKKTIYSYLSIFSSHNFYLSIQWQTTHIQSELKQLGKETSTPILCSHPVRYLTKEEAFAQECLLAIRDGKKLSEDDRTILPSNEYDFKSPSEMVELFSTEWGCLQNTVSVAKRCHIEIPLQQSLLPKYPLKEGTSPIDALSSLCKKGLKERVPYHHHTYVERLQYELSIIENMQFEDYFLIVWDFMKYAREHDIVTGPGRGSAAGSLVAYVLHITDVDPIEHHLLFERFLNPERVSMPDIDIDFPDHRRDEVIQYVKDKYGELHVAQIVTFGTYGVKAALRDVARSFGFNTKEMERLSRMVPTTPGTTLVKAYRESKQLQEFIKESDLHQKLYKTAVLLEGLPRHTSTHAAGVVISERPLVDIVPIQTGSNGIYLTQYSMTVLEEIGLLKMDFLGLRNLTILEQLVKTINRYSKEEFKLDQIDQNDSKTFELLSKGDTSGIFQLESEGMRKVLLSLKPSGFEDIVAVNALYRPGPMENIPDYVERKHGRKPIPSIHPDIDSILNVTKGVIVYQEQIMQIASVMAGFSLGEADLLRRAVSKKKADVLQKEREHFVQGATAKGYPVKLANEVYDLIVKFANYGFNRSHAVAYSMISYQLAYIKAHYPCYFLAALLTSVIGNEDKVAAYIHEARKKNIDLFSPSINRSYYAFYANQKGITYSLGAIRGVGMKAYQEILRARKEKPFEDLMDFCLRVDSKVVNRKTIESLIYAGALDEFKKDRAVLLASLDAALDHSDLLKPKGSDFALFDEEDMLLLRPKYVEIEPMPTDIKLQYEREVLGIYLSDHPLRQFEGLQRRIGALPLSDTPIGKKEHDHIVYLSEVKPIRTKKGDVMAFVKLTDQTGEVDGVVFPEQYRKSAGLLKNGAILLIKGYMEIRNDQKQLVIQSIHTMEQAEELSLAYAKALYIRLTKTSTAEDDLLEEIREHLLQSRGKTNVILHFEKDQHSIQLDQKYSVKPTNQWLMELAELVGEENIVLQ